jgi:hypothetical protein
VAFIVLGTGMSVCAIVENRKEMHCICRDNFLSASVYCVKCLT